MMCRPVSALRVACLAVGLAVTAASWPAGAEAPQTTAPSDACGPRTQLPPPIAAVQPGDRHVPVNSVTHQRIDLPGRTLCFTATAGTIELMTEGATPAPAAEVAYVAYALEGTDKRTRPVTFAVNGGPGIASAWLELGGVGPWRVPLTGDAGLPSATPTIIDNAETWLDFTDLVFIDPVGTGYSRSLLSGEEAKHRFWSVDGDIDTLADVIRRWLVEADRLDSPKFMLGESYGGFRGPRLARTLRTKFSLGLSGLLLMSPVLDFGRFNGPYNTLDWVAHLPSFAATKLAERGPVTSAAMADVEHYALGDYLSDLMRGINDGAALDRISQRVAAYTGLDPALVRNLDGRIPVYIFQREFDRKDRRVTSAYDATVSGFNPEPETPFGRFADPILDALPGPLTTGMIDLYARKLGWKLDGPPYELINNSVNRNWEWGRGEPEAITDLRAELAIDPRFRVLIMHGYSDLVTPYFETRMLLDQIPAYGDPRRLQLKVYEGGHMQYLRDDSRAALRQDARDLVEGK